MTPMEFIRNYQHRSQAAQELPALTLVEQTGEGQ